MVFKNSTHHSNLGDKDIHIARYAFPKTFSLQKKDQEDDSHDSEYGHNPSSGETWFSEKYEIRNIPTFILLKKG